MLSQRYMIAIADLKSGIERRRTVSLGTVLAVIGAVVMLPVLAAFGAAWKAKSDVQGLYASHRALEIETANYRAAVEALTEQIASQQSTIPDLGTEAARSSESARFGPAARTPVVRDSPAPSALSMPAPAPEPAIPAPAPETASFEAVATVPPSAVDGDRGADTEAAGRGAFMEALARLAQTRTLAEAADAPALASGSYRAAMALELEAQQLSTAGRLTDALVRAVEANGRFRAAEIEARLDAAALERWRPADAPPRCARYSQGRRQRSQPIRPALNRASLRRHRCRAWPTSKMPSGM